MREAERGSASFAFFLAVRLAASIGRANVAFMIDKLELLLALAKERHFGRAAEASGVSQPTLSSAVKSLEEQFGVMIVERGSRFRGFTPEGERVLDWARRLVGDTRTMRQEIEALKTSVDGHLRIGVIPTALTIVPELTGPLRARHPNIRITVTSLTSNQILDQMENLELDVGISYVDNEPVRRLKTLPLYEERYAVLVAKGHALAKRATIEWRETADLPLCLLTPDMQNRRIVDRHLSEAGVTSMARLESNSMLTLMAHVRTGEWATIIPQRLAQSVDTADALRVIPLVQPMVTHRIGLIVPSREPWTPLVSAVTAIAKHAGRKPVPATRSEL
jgi:DNA-binding transcriptional LysR family regulator